MSVVLNKTVSKMTDISATCVVIIIRFKVSCVLSGDGIQLWSLTRFIIGQLS